MRVGKERSWERERGGLGKKEEGRGEVFEIGCKMEFTQWEEPKINCLGTNSNSSKISTQISRHNIVFDFNKHIN